MQLVALSQKRSTAKWPLVGVHVSCAAALHRVNKRFALQSRPRDENAFADVLTNGNHDDFNMKNEFP